MQEFYDFASHNPWLTFFMFIIITECIVRTALALRGRNIEDD